MRPTLARAFAFPLGAVLATMMTAAAYADPDPDPLGDPPPPPPPTRISVDAPTADRATLPPSKKSQRVSYTTTVRVRNAEADYMSLSAVADGKVQHKIKRFWITADGAESCGRGTARISVMCFWPSSVPADSDFAIRLEMDVEGGVAGDQFKVTFEADADNLFGADPAEVKRTITTKVVSSSARKTR